MTTLNCPFGSDLSEEPLKVPNVPEAVVNVIVGGDIVIVKALSAVVPVSEIVALTVKLDCVDAATALAVPDNAPVPEFKLTPVGKDPDCTEYDSVPNVVVAAAEDKFPAGSAL